MLSLHRAIALSLFATVLMLSGCGGGGIGDMASYQEATKSFDSSLKTADRASKEAQMCGDPMRLRDAFVKLVPAMKALKTPLENLKISEPTLAGIHAEFLGAVSEQVDLILGMEPTIMTTKLTDSKPAIINAQKALHEAHENWKTALSESGL